MPVVPRSGNDGGSAAPAHLSREEDFSDDAVSIVGADVDSDVVSVAGSDTRYASVLTLFRLG